MAFENSPSLDQPSETRPSSLKDRIYQNRRKWIMAGVIFAVLWLAGTGALFLLSSNVFSPPGGAEGYLVTPTGQPAQALITISDVKVAHLRRRLFLLPRAAPRRARDDHRDHLWRLAPAGHHHQRSGCRSGQDRAAQVSASAGNEMKMKTRSFLSKQDMAGQGTVEFALILVLVAVVVIVSLSVAGPTIGEGFKNVLNGLRLENASQEQENKVLVIVRDFLTARIKVSMPQWRWARQLGQLAYTDIGLNPQDWSMPVEGIRWGPHGADVGLGTQAGDPYFIYVENQNGNLIKLYDGWRIWCVAADGQCYYHRVAPENIVDIRTLVLVPR